MRSADHDQPYSYPESGGTPYVPASPPSRVLEAMASNDAAAEVFNAGRYDEAVPMFFRMEPDRTRAPSSLDDFKIREPLCRSSVGVSTREPWPPAMAHKRVYVFPERGWRNESLADLQRRLP